MHSCYIAYAAHVGSSLLDKFLTVLNLVIPQAMWAKQVKMRLFGAPVLVSRILRSAQAAWRLHFEFQPFFVSPEFHHPHTVDARDTAYEQRRDELVM
jgi:hypothetical protein